MTFMNLRGRLDADARIAVELHAAGIEPVINENPLHGYYLMGYVFGTYGDLRFQRHDDRWVISGRIPLQTINMAVNEGAPPPERVIYYHHDGRMLEDRASEAKWTDYWRAFGVDKNRTTVAGEVFDKIAFVDDPAAAAWASVVESYVVTEPRYLKTIAFWSRKKP